jgi:HEAT repeat protein
MFISIDVRGSPSEIALASDEVDRSRLAISELPRRDRRMCHYIPIMIACVLVFACCHAAKETKGMRAQNLSQQLRTSADPQAREDAADALRRERLVDSALDALVQAARADDNLLVRHAAARALGDGGERAIEPLIGLWRIHREERKTQDGTIHLDAVTSLSRIGNAATPALLKALSDPEWRVRYHASLTMGFLADPATHPRLRELASDPHPMVRDAAKRALDQQTPTRPD